MATDDNHFVVNTTSTSDVTNSYFEIAQDDKMNMETNNAYHVQGLSQANISFYFSLVGGAIGFIVLIASMVWLRDNQAVVGIVAGLIIDGVSALFFSIANNASKARTDFYDKFRDDGKHKDALALCNSIEDSKIKDNLRVKLALYFSGIDESKICNKTNEVCYSDNNPSNT